jgi:radical SAM-linked protein
MVLEHAADCRHSKCHRCGVIDRERPVCAHMLRNSIRGRREEASWQPRERPAHVEPPAVQRVRVAIGRRGTARFLAHLEAMTAWMRTLRRARWPLSYSQGYHALPRVQFSTACPVGEESRADLMDVILRERGQPSELLSRLRDVLPEGFEAYGLEEVALDGPSLRGMVEGFSYSIRAAGAEWATLERRLAELLDSDSLVVERRAKSRGTRRLVEIDIRPMIARLGLHEEDGEPVVEFETEALEGRLAKPREIVKLLGLDPVAARVVKLATRLRQPAAVGEGARAGEGAAREVPAAF